MALTLEQYASYLDSRELPWPAPAELDRPRVKPHLVSLPKVRAVTWNIYGTLLAIAGGEFYFTHPKKFIMEVALDKTIQEFKMWGSMTRKPGQPADYLLQIYNEILTSARMENPAGDKYPEVAVERLWEAFVKRLMKKNYQFDAGFFGGLDEYCRKIAYFFHRSLQATAAYPHAAAALRRVASKGLKQGFIADGQCFTVLQLQRGLSEQDASFDLAAAVDPQLHVLSHDLRAKKPSDLLFRAMLDRLAFLGYEPEEVLHIGSSIPLDVVPARRAGMRTGLFIGDKQAQAEAADKIKDAANRPDILINSLTQTAEVVTGAA